MDLRADHQETPLKSEPALGGFAVSRAVETLISTHLSGVYVEINCILKTNAKRTRVIAKMVSPACHKYLNLLNFIRAERLHLYSI
jgi:hypothetical protein